MRIALLQIPSGSVNAVSNIQKAEQLMQQTPEADLYVLPEMWATGFNTSPHAEMHKESMQALEWMKQTATTTGHAIAGSLAVRECGKDASSLEISERNTHVWRNRFFFVCPDGTISHYDKCHLFSPAGEDRLFLSGDRRVVVYYQGVRFLLQTCFDLRFPESSRNHLSDSYDVAIFAASWPAERRLAWNTLLQARAIENQAFTVGVNALGCSAAYGPLGDVLFSPLDTQMQGVTIELTPHDIKRMHELRESFRVLE